MATWQCAVAKRIRNIPDSFSDGWSMYEEDPRFAGHYFLDSRSMTWALNAMILLAYMNVCLLQRHEKSDTYNEINANDVYVNGWDGSNWGDNEETLHWNMLTGDNVWFGDHCPDRVVSMGKARAMCSKMDSITALGPLLGARTARNLQVTRGVRDFPGPVRFRDCDWDLEGSDGSHSSDGSESD